MPGGDLSGRLPDLSGLGERPSMARRHAAEHRRRALLRLLQALDATDTADVYKLIVERHRSAATVVMSNRVPGEWLGLMADPLLAQSAIDRQQSAAYELVLEGESYRRRQKPGLAPIDPPPPSPRSSRRRL